MANYWKIVNKVINDADILLEVLDARSIEETRNPEIEEKVKERGKLLIFVVNKCDLADKEQIEENIKGLWPCVYVSSTEHLGFRKLRERIIIEAKRKGIEKPRVGVLGFPNVGKSSIINTLKGWKAARTSPESGFTKGLQNVRISKDLVMIDTPGVFSAEKNEHVAAVVGSIDYGKIKDPDAAVMKIMQERPGVIEKHFSVRVNNDKGKTLEEIAVKKKLLLKGEEPDIERAARMILKMVQKGEIRY